ncbi:WD40/YVTN repeat-like containing protein [Gracilaria domingensis]|nr:WD40/YVTN repeat-like containing protein [Gracilaria domingensis]
MVHAPLLFPTFLAFCLLSGVVAQKAGFTADIDSFTRTGVSRDFVGGVYAMSNNVTENTLVVYARRRNGTLKLLDPALRTGGKGAILRDDVGVDPLISAFSVIITPDYRFVLAVNAGSQSVSVFKVLRDFSLRLVHVQPVPGFGPNSIAVSGNLVYVASIEMDGTFDDLLSQTGVLSGFRLSATGKLFPILGSQRQLTSRPAAIQISPDHRSLVVSNVLSSLTAFGTGILEEIVVFSVANDGMLSMTPVARATSTELNNAEDRNLPNPIGFEIVRLLGVQYVIVPEVRDIVAADGMSPPLNQSASVSTWRLESDGRLFPVQLDVLVGSSLSSGQTASCWIEFSADLDNFWISNTGSDSLSAFSFKKGISTLEEEVVATGSLPTDLWRSRDGRFLYQLFSGAVGVFKVAKRGKGARLREIQVPMNVPDMNAAGIVAF